MILLPLLRAGVLPLILASAGFDAPQSAPASRAATRFLVVRYDDYAPRDDSSTVKAGLELEARLFELFEAHDATIVAGIIPFPTDYGTSAKRVDVERGARTTWLDQPDDPWLALLDRFVRGGAVEPALHGHSHLNRTAPGHRPAEFGVQDYAEQYALLRDGRDALTRALGRPVRVFIPPWNGWNADTIRALDELEFAWCSPDLHHDGAPQSRVRLLPQCVANPDDGLRLIDEGELPPDSILVLTTHPADFMGTAGEAYFDGLGRLLQRVEADDDWSCRGFGRLPEHSRDEWQARFRAAVRRSQLRETLLDSVGTGPFRARLSVPDAYYPAWWYAQRNAWLWIAVAATLLYPLVLGATAVWVITRSRVRRRSLITIATALAGLATVVLVVGVIQLLDRGYAIRGVRWQAIALLTGVALAGLARRLRGGRGNDESRRRQALHADHHNPSQAELLS